jgi:tetratricopeptide (TPR) repeat protein
MFAWDIHKLDKDKDPRIKMLAQLVAEAFTIHNATTHIMENEEWDFLAVYYGCIDHFCHGFMHYNPPQMPGVSDDDFAIFKDVIPNAYRLHDRMLGRLLQLAGPDTTVIVCSDHGFHSDHLRPPSTPMVPAGPAIWHRDQGLLMLQGPDIRRDELIHGANLLDITPTILRIFDLPLGRDMDGRVLLEAFESAHKIDTITSWEQRQGEHPDGMHSEDAKMTPEESKAILDQFVALGYIDPPSDDADEAAAQTSRESRWNLARAYVDGGQLMPAIAILEELVNEHPDRRDVTIAFANCLAIAGLEEEAYALKLAVLDAEDPHAFSTIMARAELAMFRKQWSLALELVEQIDTDQFDFSAAGGISLIARYMVIGSAYLKLQEWDRAFEAFQKALEIDEDYPRAWLGLAQCYNRLGQHENALEAALSAVELEHQLAQAHFSLGIAFAKTGRYEQAIDAFTTTLRYMPGYAQAHRRLAAVYARLGDYPELAERHRLEADRIRAASSKAKEESTDELLQFRQRVMAMAERLRPFYVELQEKERKEAAEKEAKKAAAKEGKLEEPVKARKEFVVVSGLPRSGTSLVMQMLQAGGMEPMTDGERVADIDNPEGYLEWEAIKKIKSNPELMEQAEGKVTKVISMLLPGLPRKHRYKVIFVMRPIEEIVASQQKMIERRGTEGASLDSAALTESLKRHRKEIIELLEKMPVQAIPVSYHRILKNPDQVAMRLAKFLGEERLPHPEKMASVVRSDLYRNRVEVTSSDGELELDEHVN